MILMLTYNDWANTGWRFYKATQHLNLPVKFYKAVNHVFKYPKQAEVHPNLANKKCIDKHPIIMEAPELKPLVDKAKIIYFTASTFIKTGADLSNKTVIVQHGGATYRKEPERTNNVFNQFSDITIQQSTDLLNLGAKNEVYISFPVDTDFIQPNFKTNRPLKIGHFPSTAINKGTHYIIETMRKFKFEINYIGKTDTDKKTWWKKWNDNLKRTAECDIIIEKMQPKLDNNLSGEWGNTALEAAALGKIVITNSYKPEMYKKEYGDFPFLIANNQKKLENHIKYVQSLSNNEILQLKTKFRDWAVTKHSIPATANRLQDKVYGRINACKA